MMSGAPRLSNHPAFPPERPHIEAILLFGSRARRDDRRGSDTDLLLVVPDGEPQHLSWDNFSMFLYSWPKLIENASQGDLFVCHLVTEAQPIFDPSDRLGNLRAAFRLKTTYRDLIEQACDLGWFLDRHGRDLNSAVVAKRMIWCARSILIAKSAEAGTPTFAPQSLAAFSASRLAADLLAVRHQRRADALLRSRFRQFLTEECPEPAWRLQASDSDFVSHFVKTGNRVALQTLNLSDGWATYE